MYRGPSEKNRSTSLCSLEETLQLARPAVGASLNLSVCDHRLQGFTFTAIYNIIIIMTVNPWESANFDPEMENMPHHTEKSQNGKIQGCKEKKPLETGGKRCKL